MSCYHPMVLLNTAQMVDPKQRQIVEKLKLLHSMKHTNKRKSYNTLFIPQELAVSEGITLRENNAVVVPCGQCIGCRLDYARIWAERAMHEAEQYEHNYFLTLTYEDNKLPVGSKGLATLVKDEISNFMRQLRDALRYRGIEGVRYFACGEYGDKLDRGEKVFNPHYHIILFNCPLPDLKDRCRVLKDGKYEYIKMYGQDGVLLKSSDIIEKIWTKGTCPIGEVTFESCNYVARYVVKKKKGKDADEYRTVGIIPPFVRMSLKPGIGHDWYAENLDRIYMTDSINLKRGDKVVTTKPGKYCDEILKQVDPQSYYELKATRREAFYNSIDCLTYEGADLAANNWKAESIKKDKVKLLQRKL